MADLKTIAGQFGMSVGEFEVFTGYSRQELHRVLDVGKLVGTARMGEMIRKLDTANYDLYVSAVQKEEKKRKEREEILKQLSSSCGLIYRSGPCRYIRQKSHPGWMGSKCRGFCHSDCDDSPAPDCEECEQHFLFEG